VPTLKGLSVPMNRGPAGGTPGRGLGTQRRRGITESVRAFRFAMSEWNQVKDKKAVIKNADMPGANAIHSLCDSVDCQNRLEIVTNPSSLFECNFGVALPGLRRDVISEDIIEKETTYFYFLWSAIMHGIEENMCFMLIWISPRLHSSCCSTDDQINC
jgi:hypothetical protein